MPFTFSHPAYAFPLKYLNPNHFSLTGLVLGSMAPDFEYFILLEPFRNIGHSLSGLLVQAIPLCIILGLIFHYIVKESLTLHLPSLFHLNQKAFNILGEWRMNSFKAWMIFVISVTVGFISHITTDACTHTDGYFVVHFSLLREVIFINLPLFKILQHSLSIIGILVILVVIAHSLYRSSPSMNEMPKVTMKQKLLFWFIVMINSVGITVAKLIITDSYNIIGILVVAPLSGLFLGLILSSLLSRIVKMRRNITRS